MTQLLRSPVLRAFGVALVAYVAAAQVFEAETLIIFLDGEVLATATAVWLMYRRRAVNGLRHVHPYVADMILIGIDGAWLMTAIQTGWRMVARVMRQEWMVTSHVIGVCLLGIALCACMHMIVKGPATKDQVYRSVSAEAWGAILVALVMGAAIGSLALAVRSGIMGG